MVSVLFDVACLAVGLTFFVTEALSARYRWPVDFIFEHINTLGGIYFAAVFFAYVTLQLRHVSSTISFCIGLVLRAVIIIALIATLATFIDIWINPLDKGEWPLATLGALVQSVPGSVIGVLVALLTRVFRRQTI
jgi:ABC-type Co2+ transport system permease subunit